ncbi:MAG: GatB/YqeY domain-containing protein [Acidobacteria bacterium]|nr:GatB/YqeY domain-containing protein [Acidobacteriota bacterium]
MTFLERINEDLKNAMKGRDADRLSTLRMVKTALKNREIEKMAPLEEAEAVKVLQTLVKQRRDSAEQYQQGGRAELAARELAEIATIEEYLPAAVDEATIVRLIDETVTATGATSAKETGAVMKAVMASLAGQLVDGRLVSQLVKARLGG